MPKLQAPSRSRAIQQALQESAQPVTLDELLAAASKIFPMDARGLKAALNSLTNSYRGTAQLIQRIADGRYVWLPKLLSGAVFRHSLSKEDLKKRYLLFEPEIKTALWLGEDYRIPVETTPSWSCELPDGTRITMRPELPEEKTWRSPWESRGEPAMWKWLESQNAHPEDALFFKIEDATGHRCAVTFEAHTARDKTRIKQRNRAVADAAFTACKHRRSIRLEDITPRLLALGLYHDPYPADSLETVVNGDSRFMWDRGYLKLATRADRTFEALGLKEPDWLTFGADELPPPARKRPPKKELAGKVYRFYATFRNSKSPWRRIEIRGDQLLRELDREMRVTFGHDTSDHLSEFYLGTDADAHQRGLGDHNPFRGGEGDEWLVGELGLEPGDELSYTYDFGDNIQHVLKLEAVVSPEKGIKYPRVAAKNEPRHSYCEVCKEDGKKEIATYICIDCSNRQQRQVLMCDKHASSEHEEHYTEEMLY